MISIRVWQSVQTQVLFSNVELESLNEDADWIEHDKQGGASAPGCSFRRQSCLVSQLVVLSEA